MSKVIILAGLPASGKSTYAFQLMESNPGVYKRVNKDELRQMLDGGRWSGDNEKFVLNLRDELIVKALQDGKSVIVDDTNLHPKHEARIRQLVDEFGAQVEVKTFDVDVNECIRRDAKRVNSVGAGIIRKMYTQFLKPTPPQIVDVESLPWAIICDMDGTLALHNGRSPYETEKCGTDLVNRAVASIVKTFGCQEAWGYKIIIVSGRDDTYYGHTTQWLSRNNIPYDDVFMRKASDKREDSIVKKELYEAHIKGKYNILFVLDDRRRVVDMWRREGLTVLQVAEGDF